MKYILFDDPLSPKPLIFSDLDQHRDIANDFPHRTVKSAGFCSIKKNDDGDYVVTCWGESISLNKKSLPTDGLEIAYMLNFRI